jgi:hypothetical protein
MNRRDILKIMGASLVYPALEVSKEITYAFDRGNFAAPKEQVTVTESKQFVFTGPCAFAREIKRVQDLGANMLQITKALESFMVPSEIYRRLDLVLLPRQYQDEIDDGKMSLVKGLLMRHDHAPGEIWEQAKEMYAQELQALVTERALDEFRKNNPGHTFKTVPSRNSRLVAYRAVVAKGHRAYGGLTDSDLS